ncbi:methyltransferase domain-containing protein [Pseudobacillus badius]|uniref:methyltransferase domain-containing protein n=1 Tax=Bacillus badius TaxID=1455 RepID=UPI0007B388AB|nr:methyltransferase domain-containing protein [Bacillus badius]KZR57886.1 hypothetical protein A3781_19100 [Bacillus badius]
MINITREYLNQMNASADDKLLMLDYIKGDTVLDVGVGGGVVGQLIKSKLPHLNVVGIEKSFKSYAAPQFVPYNHIIKADARNLHDVVDVGEVDTVIFSSVLHEVYSYNGYDTNEIYKALESAYSILPDGGRIIIRDGVKMEDNSHVVIKFKDPRDVTKVEKFVQDFEARSIQCTVVADGCVEMLMNDAMEFLYTYTWGDDAYEREVKEQYGVFTPKEYIQFIRHRLGMNLVTHNHYLQEGHNYYLSKKVELFDEEGRRTRFPDSNLLLVFQK